MHFRLRFVWFISFLLFTSGFLFAEDFTADDINNALNRAKDYESKISLPEIHSPEAEKAAAQAAGRFRSSECQKRIQAETERLKAGRFAKVLQDYQQLKENMSKVKMGMPIDERIYIFISSSMPAATLRNYAAALDKINDPNISMVLRGFVNGMKLFKPTLDFIHNIITPARSCLAVAGGKDASCDLSNKKCSAYNAAINIDPMLFSKHQITAVPAITYVQGVNMVDATMSEGKTDNLTGSQESYTVYGDVLLEYAFEQIRKETKAEGITKVLRRLQGGYYDQNKSQKTDRQNKTGAD
ncbi:MAG: type-F conjugative transfer system pilin assembly protein TrbC [Thermodesulfobacteriota bacterium]|nr:type-F conjugative transfer system pilin assembly protein TrbC [Thermodesulfobacteriota bacterium]